MQSAQALSSELALEKVVAQVMGVLIESARAERGALLLAQSSDTAKAQEPRLRLIADCQAVPGPQRLLIDEALDGNPALPSSIIKDTARSGELLVLASALADPRYTRDPYVEERRPKSVLVLPLKKNGLVRAVVYLENNQLTGAFSKERVELVRLLSGLAANAIENALLYERARLVRDFR
jgi:GAF domain-containing protein